MSEASEAGGWLDPLAEAITRSLGMALVDVAWRRRRGALHIVVTIDKPGGVTLDDCEQVSQRLEQALDAQDRIGEYSLEVESPGLDRTLRSQREFQYFRGREVEVTTYAPVEGRRHFVGTLEGLEGGRVVITAADGRRHEFPREQVARAKLLVRL